MHLRGCGGVSSEACVHAIGISNIRADQSNTPSGSDIMVIKLLHTDVYIISAACFLCEQHKFINRAPIFVDSAYQKAKGYKLSISVTIRGKANSDTRSVAVASKPFLSPTELSAPPFIT